MTVGTSNQTNYAVRGRVVARPTLRLTLDPLRICLSLLTIFAVSRIHQHFPALAPLRPALLLVVVAFLYAFLKPSTLSPEGVLRTWPARLMLALLVLACLSVPFGTSIGGSAEFILDSYGKTLLYAFLLVAAIRGASDLYTFVWAYVIGCGFLVYLAMFVFGLSEAADSLTARLGHLYTYDSNDIGLVLVVGLALSVLAFQTSDRRGKIVAGIVIAGIGATIARSGSRGSFVALLALGLGLLVMLRTVPIAKRLGFVAITAIALAIAAPRGYWQQMGTIVSPTQDYNWTTQDGRKAVATRGLGYMMAHPVFGLGIDNFWRAECFFSNKARNAAPNQGVRCTSPHNSYVQAGAELGIPGIILWTSLVICGVVGMAKLRRRLPRSWARGTVEERFLYMASMYLTVALMGFAAAAMFVAFAWLDIIYILAAFMAGLYVCAGRLAPHLAAPQRRMPPLRGRGRPVPPGVPRPA